MKRLAVLAFALLLTVWAAGPIGRPAPSFRGPTLAGGTFDLAEHLGRRPIVLHFWASNCPPCHVEAPYWAQAQQAYGDRLLIVGVDVQDIPTMAREFVARYGWTFPNVQDGTAAVAAAYRVTGKPTTVFIGIDGTVVGYHPGPYGSAAAFEQDLLRLLAWRP
jgi:cytochrome c biogenesis protein CcmG/thiol:disulfide interchange protein DsbE